MQNTTPSSRPRPFISLQELRASNISDIRKFEGQNNKNALKFCIAVNYYTLNNN